MAGRSRPTSRDEFEVAIVCALPIEFDAVSLLIDESYDDNNGADRYGRATGDPNTYKTGRIGDYAVVLVLLPSMGKVSAASASASLRSSYPGLELVLVTGICGGVPFIGGGGEGGKGKGKGEENEILLGDVVVSQAVIQYDLRRQYPDGFAVKDAPEERLGGPSKRVRALLTGLKTHDGEEKFERQIMLNLEGLQRKHEARSRRRRRTGASYQYPGAANDRLFASSYRHKHHLSHLRCDLCARCRNHSDPVCEPSRLMSCAEVGCDEGYLVKRRRLLRPTASSLPTQHVPRVFVGRVGSGDTVLKSGEDRDRMAKQYEIIAFEMEAAGVWDEGPCLVVKGVCDYADSHKNKNWQHYASASAAAAAKALLDRYTGVMRGKRIRRPSMMQHQQFRRPAVSTIPFGPNPHFVERPEVTDWLRRKLTPDLGQSQSQSQGPRTVRSAGLIGPGGIGYVLKPTFFQGLCY